MKLLLLIPLLFFGNRVAAQYTLNGSASANSCHCYTLTPNAFTRSGSVWNNNKINLTQSFDFNFDIYLGCADGNGADGIVFVLQPISTSVGTTGGGLGVEGISPSVAVTIDTWQNSESNDPSYDHIAVQLNGNIDHANTTANIAGPVTVLAGSDNIEDCQWHTLRVKWDAATNELTAYIDGGLRVTVVKNFVADVFAGNPDVFWGFTGSTGGSANLQQFCTALSPLYKSLQAQKRCINEPITFYDSTISFTTVQKRYWDFGDGSDIDSVNLNPVHTYIAAGDYTVKQTVIGADGCSEINTQTVRVSGKPVPAFTYNDSCEAGQIQFSDASAAAFGNINSWYWDFGNGTSLNQASVVTNFATGGDKEVKLLVKTEEGCESDTLKKTVHIYSRPVLDFTFNDSVCLGATMNFTGRVISSPDPIQTFAWNLGDNTPRPTQNTNYQYQTTGPHTVIFLASTTGNAGCLGLIEKTVFVRGKPTAAFKNDFVCQSTSTALQDSSYSDDGKAITNWHWDFGNGQTANLQNPSVTFNNVDTIEIKLAVQSGGCASDTLVKPLVVSARPIANFGFGNANCEGQLIQFSDSSTSQNSTVSQWEWWYQNAQWSSEQNPSKAFIAGNQTVGLSVISDKGCKSTITNRSFPVIARPLFNVNFNDACAGSAVNFSANDISGNIQKWLWDFGDGSTAAIKDTAHIYNNGGSYSVILSVEAGNGCVNSDTSSITIYKTDAAVTDNTIIAAANQPVQLNATGGINYEWLPVEGLSNAAIENPVATNTEDRQYTVRAYTPLGCDSYDTVLIKIYNGPTIYVPAAFNPRSVAGNNIFRVIPVGIAKFKYFNVYNRFGQLVFSTDNAANGWDGNFKSQPQPPGVYVWVTAGTTFRGNEILKKGTVVLVR